MLDNDTRTMASDANASVSGDTPRYVQHSVVITHSLKIAPRMVIGIASDTILSVDTITRALRSIIPFYCPR